MGFVDGPNMYTYVVQNPWSSFDPEGLKTKKQYQDSIDKAKKSNESNRARKAELNKAKDAHENGERTSAEAREVEKLDKEWIKNESIIVGAHIGIAHLEASAKAISVVTGQEVAEVESYLDDRDSDGPFKDGLTLARTGRVAELAASYYGGKLAGAAAGKLLDAIVGKALAKGASKIVQADIDALNDAWQKPLEEKFRSRPVQNELLKMLQKQGMSLDDAVDKVLRIEREAMQVEEARRRAGKSLYPPSSP